MVVAGTGAIVAAVVVIQAVIAPYPAPGYVDVANRAGLRAVRLDVDRTVTAVGHPRIVSGATYRYAFRVTNTGSKPVLHLAVRSDQVVEPRAESSFDVRYVSNPDCSGNGQVDCLFDAIPPGTTRRVTVEAATSATRAPGDRLIIYTYMGRFMSAPDGSATFDVMGRCATTSATFAANSG
jgi:hypothetical protein